MATNKLEFQKLADINSRTACPRCDGFGFIHASVDKHDRATSLRCKKCIDCSVCETSGITVGVIKCLKCFGIELWKVTIYMSFCRKGCKSFSLPIQSERFNFYYSFFTTQML
jgi:hypothetical protein